MAVLKVQNVLSSKTNLDLFKEISCLQMKYSTNRDSKKILDYGYELQRPDKNQDL